MTIALITVSLVSAGALGVIVWLAVALRRALGAQERAGRAELGARQLQAEAERQRDDALIEAARERDARARAEAALSAMRVNLAAALEEIARAQNARVDRADGAALPTAVDDVLSSPSP